MTRSSTARQRVRVSICAAKDDADVRAVVRGGADAVGVLVQTRHVAEDAVDLSVGAKILDTVPPYVGRYAVTHAVALADLLECIDTLPIDTLQLHDTVDPHIVARVRNLRPHIRLLKAVHVADQTPDCGPWPGLCDGLVFDSIDLAADRIGGTGRVHDWRCTAKAASQLSVPFVIAGGLHAENVADAVTSTRPWAINANSGVESNGAKDEMKIFALVNAANTPASRNIPSGGCDDK